MARLLRTFVAISISPNSAPAEELQHEVPDLELSEIIAELRAVGAPVNAVDESNLHVTLKFLGPTHPELITSICERLQMAAADVLPFVWELRSIGAFPSSKRPSIIWAGLSTDNPCQQLAADIGESLTDLGFPIETRKFKPHVTLARVKGRPPEAIFDLLHRHDETRFGRRQVTTIKLMQSELQQSGAIYTTLKTIPLGSLIVNPGDSTS